MHPDDPHTGNIGSVAGLVCFMGNLPTGERNTGAFWAFNRTFEMLARGEISEQQARHVHKAALHTGLDPDEVDRSWRSAEQTSGVSLLGDTGATSMTTAETTSRGGYAKVPRGLIDAHGDGAITDRSLLAYNHLAAGCNRHGEAPHRRRQHTGRAVVRGICGGVGAHVSRPQRQGPGGDADRVPVDRGQ